MWIRSYSIKGDAKRVVRPNGTSWQIREINCKEMTAMLKKFTFNVNIGAISWSYESEAAKTPLLISHPQQELFLGELRIVHQDWSFLHQPQLHYYFTYLRLIWDNKSDVSYKFYTYSSVTYTATTHLCFPLGSL